MCHVLCCWTPCHSSTCCVLLSLPQIGNIIKPGYRCRIGYNWQWWSSFRPVWSGVNFFLLLQLFLFSTKTLAMPIFLHQTIGVANFFGKLACLHIKPNRPIISSWLTAYILPIYLSLYNWHTPSASLFFYKNVWYLLVYVPIMVQRYW